MSTLHISKGEMSISIFDIHSFLELSLSGRLYDKVVPTQQKLTNKLPPSCTYLFTAYRKRIQGRKVRDVGYIYPGTFSVVSFMASGVGHCLSKVTNEIKEHLKSSLAEICRQEYKSIVNPTIIGQDELPIEVCELSTKKGESDHANFKEELGHIPLLSGMPRLPHPLRAPQGVVFVFNTDAVARVFGQAILDKVSRTPFDGLQSLKGDFNSFYATILQVGVDITPSENKVKGLIRQACGLKIDIINATKVMDAATKASLEKTEAYIKKSFEDLKNSQ
ncbi:hypothetical protein Cgig2_022614 [Carnegiea gigantea]|uniref:Uncharacterized protein n=1 Tax=Carnegiea gigantea TaxID=171969 RepID=A0A9Q1JUP6_9CARY|nr:hypothetical protein Cgig2_022614 [Carnegiea gigantea]